MGRQQLADPRAPHLQPRDRFFEAGFDDDVLLAGAAALPTSVFAQYAAMGLVAALGVAGFVAKAYQDTRMVERVQIMTR